MKIAFLFLTRCNHHSEICWNLFFKNINPDLYSIYCHPKSIPSQVFLKNNLVKNMISTKWADISLVRATLILLANAYKEKKNSHFILLSESCVPIVNFSILYKRIKKLEQSVFHFKHLSNKLNRYQLLSPVIRNKLSFSNFYCQHQWMLLLRNDVIFFISQDLTNYFSATPASDEHYFISLMVLYKKYKNIINKKITYCDWSDQSSMHPKIYDKLNINFIHKLQKEGYLFIRKVGKTYQPDRNHIQILLS